MASDKDRAGQDDLRDMVNRTREKALGQSAKKVAELPLRYLRQQAHLTAPSSNPDLAEKAISGGFGVAGRLLQRYGISTAELAERLEMSVADVEDTLAGDTSAPVVMLDLEDGVAPHLATQARDNVIRMVRESKWGSSLRFYRPSGMDSDRCVDDLVYVLTKVGEGIPPEKYPMDALVYPKIQHVHEVEWLFNVLNAVEEKLGLAKNRIRVAYLVEAAWATHNLADLVAAGRDRMAGLIVGGIDFSASVGIPAPRYRHPVIEWARYEIVTAAGAIGVPAIDFMTMNFPVASQSLTPEQNKERILSRMRENFDDTHYSMDLGFAGRWVGHPLQLLATMLAFRSALKDEAVEAEVAKVEEFSRAIAADKGAAASSKGELIDVATDRQAREWLRRAVAWGRFSKDRALALGIITAEEAKELP